MIVPLVCILISVVPCFGRNSPFIIGGSQVDDATRWPWQGSLRVFGLHNCGCALLSSTWTVTAAHCSGYSILFYDIRFGSTHRDQGGIIVVPEKIVVHEDWDNGPGSFPNDIALMRINGLTIGSTIKPIEMTREDQAGKECFISGWGWMETGASGDFPDILQEARVNVYSRDECKLFHGSSINSGHVCVGDPNAGRGSCKGDSGGPLMCDVGGKYELVGVSSWAVSGCLTTKPAVYTRVAQFREWAESHMRVH